MQFITSGTIVVPTPAGALSTLAGPTFGGNATLLSTSSSVTGNNVVVGATTGGPSVATTYYVQLAYASGTAVSLPGAEFLIYAAANVLPTILVNSGPVGFAASYVGIYSGGEVLQNSSATGTATGSALTLANGLTNNNGINRSVTNPSSNIVGIAMHDAVSVWAGGAGGNGNVGLPGNTTRLGAWGNPYPLGNADPLQPLVAQLSVGTPIEICLKQPWYNSLAGTAVGVALDASGWFVADTSGSNKIGNIIQRLDLGGNQGDTYARVQVNITGGVI